ncbi:hypothetical protein TcG_11263 [Trypanosoma cruzi]|nr:hypothetical protein TcG_11263 [Trypanosoma cruzi]
MRPVPLFAAVCVCAVRMAFCCSATWVTLLTSTILDFVAVAAGSRSQSRGFAACMCMCACLLDVYRRAACRRAAAAALFFSGRCVCGTDLPAVGGAGSLFAIYLVAYCDTSAMVCVSEERRLDCSRTANPPLLFRVTTSCCGRNNMAPKNASDLQCCLSRGTGHGDGEVFAF